MRKRYPPSLTAIYRKNEEARKKGVSYGMLVASDFEPASRPQRRSHPTGENEEIEAYLSANEEAYNESRRRILDLRKSNQEKFGKSQTVIRVVRKRMGLSALKFAALVGASDTAIRSWELGWYPADWSKLVAAIPELKRYAPEEEK